MSKPNIYGLMRDIPEPIKREIRQRCGFGCVVCGNPFVEYHHFDPPFTCAKQHSPDGITILCSSCHTETTNGLRTEANIRARNADPYCRRQGHVSYTWVAAEPLGFQMGQTTFYTPTVLMYETLELIGYQPPETSGAPWRLSAQILDRDGVDLLRIEGNEWKAGIDRYDIATKGNTIEVRQKKGEILLIIDLEIDRLLHIRRLTMECFGVTLSCNDNSFSVMVPSGGRVNLNNRCVVSGDIGVHILPSANQVLIGAGRNGSAAISQAIIPEFSP